MRTPAQVADMRLELVERCADVAVDLEREVERRDRLGRDPTDDDVGCRRADSIERDPDVERRQPPLDVAPLDLELGPATVEARAQVGAAIDKAGRSRAWLSPCRAGRGSAAARAAGQASSSGSPTAGRPRPGRTGPAAS